MSAESKSTHSPGHTSEPLFTRLIVAPVLFVSFLISLFLIDRKTYGTVFSHHPDPNSHSHSHSSTISHDGDDEYYHSHKRKLARQEMEDAFALRSKVIAGFAILGGVSVAIVGWCGSKFFQAIVSG